MDDGLFRKKSLEKISSPEQLDSYIKVISNGAWIFIIAIICLLTGFITWGFAGKLKTYVYGVATVDGINVVAYFDSYDYSYIADGQNCKINGVDFKVEIFINDPIKVDENIDEYIVVYGGFYEGEYVNTVYFDNKGLTNGVYTCQVEVAEVSPFSFLFN